jgi:hypothetical protein
VAATTQVRLLVRSLLLDLCWPTMQSRSGHRTRSHFPKQILSEAAVNTHRAWLHIQAAIAQLAARRSHNPKVVSSILTGRILRAAENLAPRTIRF